MKKVYKGLISEKEYQGLPLTVIVTKEFGTLTVEALFQEFIDNGKVYRVTIEEVKEESQNVSMPITAERELVKI